MQLQDLQQETTDYHQDIERMTFRIIRCEEEIWNHYLIFLIYKILNTLCNTKYYTKMNIIAAFNKLRITEREKWKTAFLIKYDFFEYLIMSWELQNVSVTFQHFINSMLHEFLDKFVSVYLNDIIIYLKIKKKHWEHVTKVLQVLQRAELQLNINKCEFTMQKIKYLELIIISEKIKMNSQKVKVILK